MPVVRISIELLTERGSITKWAKTYPRPSFSPVYMNDVSAGTFEQWTMAKLGDGNYTFRNVGTGYWACARNDAVVGIPEFDEKSCKWKLDSTDSDDGQFRVTTPDGGFAWTVGKGEPEDPTSLVLYENTGFGSQDSFRFPAV